MSLFDASALCFIQQNNEFVEISYTVFKMFQMFLLAIKISSVLVLSATAV